MGKTLAMNYDDLRAEVGQYLGFGDTLDDFGTDELSEVDRFVQNGLRKFYAPPRPGMVWSFLQPVRDMKTTTDVESYQLPPDFGGYEGRLTVTTTSGSYAPVEKTSDLRIRELRSASNSTGVPREYAIVANRHVPGGETSWRIELYPSPDASYTLRGKMLIAPLKLSNDNPYPYGGPLHAQTILLACLSEAELHRGPVVGHSAAYQSQLTASVEIDKQQARPENLGYNYDPSTPESYTHNGLMVIPSTVTFNGVQY